MQHETETEIRKRQTQAFALAQKKRYSDKKKSIVHSRVRYKIHYNIFLCCPGNITSILSYKTAVELGIIPAIGSVDQENNNTDIPAEFPTVSNQLGKLQDVQNRPGKTVTSDYLSRHPDQRNAPSGYVNLITQHALKPHSLRLEQV